jgi:hypothetical protein
VSELILLFYFLVDRAADIYLSDEKRRFKGTGTWKEGRQAGADGDEK